MGLPDIYPRAIDVHLMLKGGAPVTTASLAEKFGISPRQAQRVIEHLRHKMKAPVVYDRLRGTYYYQEPTFELPAQIMREGDAIGMILAHEALLRRQGTPLGRHLRRAIGTLRALLPESVSVDAEGLLKHVMFAPLPARTVSDDLLDAVGIAIERRARLRIEYYSPAGDETTQRDIDIYHLAHVRGDWYAVAYCHLRKALRTFALSRMKSVRLLDVRYQIPATFSVAEYFKDALGVLAGPEPQTVVLAFDAEAARWVRERVWHPTQTLESLDDGGLRLTMCVTLSVELTRWILSWGGHVRALSPAPLRQQLEREVRAMAALHAG